MSEAALCDVGAKGAVTSCQIIGEGTLPRLCGDLLLARGWCIRGVISPDSDNRAWAREHGIPAHDAEADLAKVLSDQPFDYLFSIVNGRILQPDLLALPRKGAINFHDSALSRRAGLNASTWAIVQGETEHAISWHQMEERVDTGTVLKQRTLPISPDDTSLTLNAKCYRVGADTFGELLDELQEGTLKPVPQDISRQIYYSRCHLPDAGGLLDWSRPAAELDALVRAMDFGRLYPNPMLRPKIAVGDEFVICGAAGVVLASTKAEPGILLAVNADALHVACGDGCALALQSLETIDGEELPIVVAIERFDLGSGRRLPLPEPDLSQRLSDLSRRCCLNDGYWVKRCRQMEPVSVPYAIGRKSEGRGPLEEISLPLPATFAKLDSSSRGRLLLGVFVAFLARLSEAEGFDIGWASGETARLGAFFAPWVPLRMDPDLSGTLRAFAATLSAELELVQGHPGFPRDLLARYPELNLHRSAHHFGCLDVVVVEGVAPETVLRWGAPGLLLALPVGDVPPRWFFDPRRLPAAQNQPLMSRFQRFLRELDRDPEQPLATVPLLEEQETHLLLDEWNRTRVPMPQGTGVHQLFEAWAERNPEAAAVVDGGLSLSYGELNRQANRLAHFLRNLGVGADIPVAIVTERSLVQSVAILGVLKAGGAYLPIDPEYPEKRKEWMLSDSAVRVILTQKPFEVDLPVERDKVQILLLDSEPPPWDGESDTNPDPRGDPERAAYMIYTSGTTGRPKGVMVPHRGVVNHCLAMRERFALTPEDRVLQFFSISFDGAVEELFPCWAAGATLVLRSADLLNSVPQFMDWIEEQAISVLDLPTAYWHQWMEVLGRSERPLPDPLRLVIVGGEKASREAFDRWNRLADGRVRWINSYGPTECTVVSLVLEPGVECTLTERGELPIGRPIANTQLYVVDSRLQLVPPGVPGELLIGGDGVARGYLNRPDLTAEKFIENSFDPERGGRLYRTGDRVRYRPDGIVEFLGRVDDQVKLRGFRIEPGEVAALLDQHPRVARAAVVPRTDRDGQLFLVAYWIPGDPPWPETVELRDHLRQGLPDYMVPSSFVRMEEFPLTPAGKLDLRALPEPIPADRAMADSYVPPSTPLQQTLAKIWARALKLKRVGVDDNFFDLGGHSLLVMEVFEHAMREGLELNPQDLFRHQTIAELAEALASGTEAGSGVPSLVPLQADGERPPLFLVHSTPGDVMGYANLVHRLGRDQPCFGLQSLGLQDLEQAHDTLEDMAAYYVERIRSVQPEGPYFLVGWCYGGFVAVEMARLLKAKGQVIGLLGLIEARVSEPGVWSNRYYLDRVMALVRMGPLGWLRYFRAKLAGGGGNADMDAILAIELEHGHMANREEVYRKNMAAYYRYRFSRYPGKVTLFFAEQQAPGIIYDPNLGWKAFADTVERHAYQAEHNSILQEPHITDLANRLRACIDRGMEEAGGRLSRKSVAEKS